MSENIRRDKRNQQMVKEEMDNQCKNSKCHLTQGTQGQEQL
jgi:hypothetical protein